MIVATHFLLSVKAGSDKWWAWHSCCCCWLVWRGDSVWQVEHGIDDEGSGGCGAGCDDGSRQRISWQGVWHPSKTQRQVAVDASLQLRTRPWTFRRGHLESVSIWCSLVAASTVIYRTIIALLLCSQLVIRSLACGMPRTQYSTRSARFFKLNDVHISTSLSALMTDVSRDSIVDRSSLPASALYAVCRQLASDVAENWCRFLVRSVQARGMTLNWFGN